MKSNSKLKKSLVAKINWLPAVIVLGHLLVIVVYFKFQKNQIADFEPTQESPTLYNRNYQITATPLVPVNNPVGLAYIAPKKTPTPIAENETFQLGGFKLVLPAGSVLNENYDGELKVQVTKITPQASDYERCFRVSNIHSLYYQDATPYVDISAASTFFWYSWSPDQLKFENQKYEDQYNQKIANLETVFNLPDGKIQSAQKLDFNIQALTSCAGVWFIPVYKQNIDNSGFNKAMYVEVNTGNGDPYTLPKRFLVIKHNGNWLVAEESPGYTPNSEMNAQLMRCFNTNSEGSTLQNGIDCASQVWDRFRTQEGIAYWVQNMISVIH